MANLTPLTSELTLLVYEETRRSDKRALAANERYRCGRQRVFTFFLLDLLLLLRSESDELSSLVSMNSLLLKLSPPRSRSLSPPADFLFFSSFLPPDFLLSLRREKKRC